MRHAVAAALVVLALHPAGPARADLLTPKTLLVTWADAFDACDDDDLEFVDPADENDVLLTGCLERVRLEAVVGGRTARLTGRFVIAGGRLAPWFGAPGEAIRLTGRVARFTNPAGRVHGIRTTVPGVGDDFFAEAALLTPDAPITAEIRRLLLHGRRGRLVLAAGRRGGGRMRLFGSADPERTSIELQVGRVRLDLGAGGRVVGRGRTAWHGLAAHGVTRVR